MKTLKYFAFALLAICLVACGDGKVTPASKKINGPLGKFFEVVERDYKIADGVINVEIKRIENGGPKDASWSTRPTFTLELLDGDGDVISSESTDVVLTEDQLEAVFSLGIDETSSISFKVDESKGAEKFKISSKWEDDGEEASDEPASDSGDQSVDLRGTVDKYPVTMHLEISGSQVKGSYYYDRKGPDAQLNLVGTNDNGLLDINETDADGTPTGHFKGNFSNGMYTGQFITNKGKKMPFRLSEGGVADDASFDSDFTSDSNDGGGSEDWDAILASYERYVDKYISYMKKAKSGDISALSEYPSLLEEAQSYSEKLQHASGQLSASQLARYQKITNKMLTAAQ